MNNRDRAEGLGGAVEEGLEAPIGGPSEEGLAAPLMKETADCRTSKPRAQSGRTINTCLNSCIRKHVF